MTNAKGTALAPIRATAIVVRKATGQPELGEASTALALAIEAGDMLLRKAPWLLTADEIRAAGASISAAARDLRALRKSGDRQATETEITQIVAILGDAFPQQNANLAGWLNAAVDLVADFAPTVRELAEAKRDLIRDLRFRPAVSEIHDALEATRRNSQRWRSALESADNFDQTANDHLASYSDDVRAALIDRAALEICGCSLTTDGAYPADVLQAAVARVDAWASHLRNAATTDELNAVATECADLRQRVNDAIRGPLGAVIHRATRPGCGGPLRIAPTLAELSARRAQEIAPNPLVKYGPDNRPERPTRPARGWKPISEETRQQLSELRQRKAAAANAGNFGDRVTA